MSVIHSKTEGPNGFQKLQGSAAIYESFQHIQASPALPQPESPAEDEQGALHIKNVPESYDAPEIKQSAHDRRAAKRAGEVGYGEATMVILPFTVPELSTEEQETANEQLESTSSSSTAESKAGELVNEKIDDKVFSSSFYDNDNSMIINEAEQELDSRTNIDKWNRAVAIATGSRSFIEQQAAEEGHHKRLARNPRFTIQTQDDYEAVQYEDRAIALQIRAQKMRRILEIKDATCADLEIEFDRFALETARVDQEWRLGDNSELTGFEKLRFRQIFAICMHVGAMVFDPQENLSVEEMRYRRDRKAASLIGMLDANHPQYSPPGDQLDPFVRDLLTGNV